MNDALVHLSFDTEHIGPALDALSPEAFDALDFGVIGFDAPGVVRAYNQHESEAAGLSRERTLGRALFTQVAPCMNNALVAQRFHDAQVSGTALDVTIDYVLTMRMRPTRVAMRLVATPGAARAYVLIRRLGVA